MKLIKTKLERRPHIGDRRQLRLIETPLGKASAFQISQLHTDRTEPYHTNRSGYVLCFVVTGWMEAHCAGKNYQIGAGEGIVFEPGERHRINKGKGWMMSISSIDYNELETRWELNQKV